MILLLMENSRMKPKKKSAEMGRIKKDIKKILDTPKRFRVIDPKIGPEINKWLWQVQSEIATAFKCPRCKKKKGCKVVFAKKGKSNQYTLTCGCGLYKKSKKIVK